MVSKLVQIGAKKSSATAVSRRRFVQGVGVASAGVLTACADSNKQKVFPHVRGEDSSIPGVALWYRSTCTECSAGCGITARTREGRVVKLEGSPVNPVNQGSLCALGQSALQALYDPDRIRQPLQAPSAGARAWADFAATTWDAVLNSAASELRAAGGKRYFFTGEVTGATEAVVTEFCEKFGLEHIVYDVTQPVALAQATEDVFGEYGIPHYHLEGADYVLNFGADFLETWVSPAEYSRMWAQSRRKKIPTKYVHIEPRLSQTAASADTFLAINPGTENALLHYLTRALLSARADVPEAVRGVLQSRLDDQSLVDVSQRTGLSRERISLLVEELRTAKNPLVLAGGSATNSVDAHAIYRTTHVLNSVLGAVGTRVDLRGMRKPKTSLTKVRAAIEAMDSGEVDVVIVDSSNPVFSLPADYGFAFAIRKVSKLRLSLSSFKDETTSLSSHVLPSSHSLESWGDSESVPGLRSIIQPVMKPVFDTRSLGDTLLALARLAGSEFEATDFREFVKERWRSFHRESGSGENFERWFLESVEQGGRFQRMPYKRPGARARSVANLRGLAELELGGSELHGDADAATDLVYLPFLNIKALDGRGANRGWLQELPDPLTKIVWDAWAEIHPETAAKNSIAHGDLVAVRNRYGEVKVPAYLTPHVSRNVVAVPLGQGHSEYGRFASQVRRSTGGVLKERDGDLGPRREFRTRIDNAYDLLPSLDNRDAIAFVVTRVGLHRLPAKSKVAITQRFETQMKRPIVQLDSLDKNGDVAKVDYYEHEFPHGEDMYVQRKHPLYQWGMTIDLAACTGCSACIVACNAENNVPVVGKSVVAQERHMSWIRLDRYFDGPAEQPITGFQPMMCQHCQNAPCEPVCPVYATYHNDEGLNVMVYNRCVGTRYCGNNCSYKVRRFNWFDYEFPSPLDWQLNPDVTKRTAGVMEKCTFCVQRINEAKDRAKDLGRLVQDGEVQPACAQTCPTQAITFGNLKDDGSQVAKLSQSPRAYKVLDYHLNTQPSVSYLRNRKFSV